MHKSADHVCSTSVHWTFSFTIFSSTLHLISFIGVTSLAFAFLSLSLSPSSSPSLFHKPKRLQAMSFSPEYLQLGHKQTVTKQKLSHLLCNAVKQCKAKV